LVHGPKTSEMHVFDFNLSASNSYCLMTSRDSLVFLINHNKSVRKGVARLLYSAGYTSAVFDSASDFLARAPYSGPCCAILDLRMPGLNGIGLRDRTSLCYF
jgi:FixJ family two-component response regulator